MDPRKDGSMTLEEAHAIIKSHKPGELIDPENVGLEDLIALHVVSMEMISELNKRIERLESILN